MTVPGPPKIVVLGMMTKMPVAGVVWQTVQYVVGLQRLGFDVHYVEAHARTPSMLMTSEDDDSSALAAEFIDSVMRRFGLAGRWAYHALHDDGRVFGMDADRLQRLYRDAAAILNLHGGTQPRDEHRDTGRLVYVETDPVQLQLELAEGVAETVAFLEAHSAFFTFGENYARAGCTLPVDDRFRFVATRQPVVLDFWSADPPPRGRPLTTIGNWRQEWRTLDYRGEQYHWSKHLEFLKVLELPRTSGASFELALSSYTDDDEQLLRAHGWQVRPAMPLSTDLDAYRAYINDSAGEFTVAKDQNVRFRSGWFSDRSATYLAAGRPVVTQDTGFGCALPVGEGLFAFHDLDTATAAVQEVVGNYERHAKAARDLAEEHFDAPIVLAALLDEVGVAAPPVRPHYSVDRAMDDLRDANPWYACGGGSSDAQTRSITGVNVVGYLRDESGWGAAGRGYVRALESLDFALGFTDVSHLTSNRSQDATVSTLSGGEHCEVNLICVDAGQHFGVMDELSAEQFDNGYNIGAWAWELPRFPEKWYDRFAYYDEIWVATSFISNVLAPISPVPVVRVPPVLTPTALGCREQGRSRLQLGRDDFLFLFVFDVHSHIERKNPLAVIEAFTAAFGSQDRARLVIKTVNGDADAGGLARLRSAAEGRAVTFLDGYWPADEVRDLMAACDCYVSLHRSEGTGLTITDAMALGKPVVATGWSGNMDFMTVSNSYPVVYDLVTLTETVGPYPAGQQWAQASVSHAAALLRHVYDHPEDAAAKGAVARLTIEQYSTEQIAALVEQRLHVIATRDRFATLKAERQTFATAYRDLTGDIRRIAQDVVPEGATILVASKGDTDVVQIAGRRGAHFPQTPDGVYAGFHPRDSSAAIDHLELLREGGATFLLLPATSFWWLEHYGGFRRHLETRYVKLWDDERCAIFDLTHSVEATA